MWEAVLKLLQKFYLIQKNLSMINKNGSEEASFFWTVLILVWINFFWQAILITELPFQAKS